MMFEAENYHALQTLINNGTSTPDDQKVPIRVLNAILAIRKEEELFWHYRDESLSDF